MAELCELVEVVPLIAKLLVQLSEIRVDDDLTVHAHSQNKFSHRGSDRLIHLALHRVFFFGSDSNRNGFRL